MSVDQWNTVGRLESDQATLYALHRRYARTGDPDGRAALVEEYRPHAAALARRLRVLDHVHPEDRLP